MESEWIEYKGKLYPPCRYCRGKGFKNGYQHVQGGVCFQCEGYKSMEVYKIKKERRDEKNKAESIEYFTSEVLRLRKALEGKTAADMKAIDKARINLLKRSEEALLERGVVIPYEDK